MIDVFAAKLWKALEDLPCETDGAAALIVDFEKLKAALGAVTAAEKVQSLATTLRQVDRDLSNCLARIEAALQPDAPTEIPPG